VLAGAGVDPRPRPKPACAKSFRWPRVRRDASLSAAGDAALESVRDGSDLSENRGRLGSLDLRGTVFQLRVLWQALRAIPRGETRSYSQLAREMGRAARRPAPWREPAR